MDDEIKMMERFRYNDDILSIAKYKNSYIIWFTHDENELPNESNIKSIDKYEDKAREWFSLYREGIISKYKKDK